MRITVRAIASVVMAGLLTLTMTMTAAALVWKTGNRNCTPNYSLVIYSYSTGYTQHIFPSGYNVYYSNGSTWLNRRTFDESSGTGGLWAVNTNGSLSDAGTYSACVVTGPR